MGKGKELFKNTIILFIGIFFTKLIQYFLLPVYTGYLSTSEYGSVDLFNTIITLLIPIIGLQVEQGVFRFLIAKRNNLIEQKELISSSFFFVLFSTIICLTLMFVVNPFINNDYKFIVELNLILTWYSSYLMQVARGLGKNKEYAISGVVISIFNIIFNIIFLVGIGMKINGMLYGATIGYFVGILYLSFRLHIKKYISSKSVSKKALKMILGYSLPMIPNSLSWWIFSSSDRFIVTSIIGLSATGVLSVAYKFSNIGIVIYNVFNLSLTESVSLHIDDDDIESYFNKVYEIVGQLFITIGSLLIAFMPIMFTMLINTKFINAYGLIPIAIIATEFQVFVGMLGTIYVAKNNTKSIAMTSVIAAIINITVDLVLIKYCGVYAAVISTFVSYFVLFIYRYIEVRKKYFHIKMGKMILFNLAINILVISTLYYINNIYIKIFNAILAILCIVVFNNNNYKYLFNLIKQRRIKSER